MPTAKKRTSTRSSKSCGKSREKISHTIMQDFVQHKTSVLVIMAAALSLGALFSMMLGVSASNL